MNKPLPRRLAQYITRKNLLAAVTSIAAAVPLLSLGRLISNRKTAIKAGKALIRLPLDLPQGISLHEKIIINRSGDDYSAYSARCPHLGCRIDTYRDGKLMCPCHGSTFDNKGNLLSGPATSNLVKLEHTLNAKDKVLIIEQA